METVAGAMQIINPGVNPNGELKYYKHADAASDPMATLLGLNGVTIRKNKRGEEQKFKLFCLRCAEKRHMAKGLPPCEKPFSDIKHHWPPHLKEIARKMRVAAKVEVKYEPEPKNGKKKD